MAADDSKTPAIGIDLGTTYSCVGIFQDEKVEIITNDLGMKTTPSYVAFTDIERFVGDPAKTQAVRNPENTIYDVKRLIGRRYDDPEIQEDLHNWPFKVKNVNGSVKIQVNYRKETKMFSPEEISAMVLEKMKEIAENFLGHKVLDAVITVPAYFNDSQRQATKDAGAIAGLNVLRLAIEPTAAALAFGLDKSVENDKIVLIYDLGGGTFDVSILTIGKEAIFEVMAVAGDTHLGGEDFNKRMEDYFASEFKRKFRKELKKNPKAIQRLKGESERIKRMLTSCSEASLELDAIHEGIDFYMNISRSKFEDLCMDLFDKTLELVAQALSDAKVDKTKVNDVVLVGGSTRIPKIQKLLKDFFGGKELCKSFNPDETVAYGAALQAALFSGHQSEKLKSLRLVDVAPISLGIKASNGLMENIIERNTKLPTKRSKFFSTVTDNQTCVGIRVYEGERAFTMDNHFLGEFTLTDIPPAPRKVPFITLTFELDENGILYVSAHERKSGKQESILITMNKGRLSQRELDRMLADAEKYRLEDEKQRQRLRAKQKLEDYVYEVKHEVAASGAKLSPRQKDNLTREIDKMLQWIDEKHSARKEEYENKAREMQKACGNLIKKLHLG